MNFIAHQIRRVTPLRFFRLILRRALKNPADVRPESSFARRVRVFVGFGKSVVNAVRRHPIYRYRLQSERSAEGQKIFDKLRRFETAMRQQTVIAHSDAPASRNPPGDKGGKQI